LPEVGTQIAVAVKVGTGCHSQGNSAAGRRKGISSLIRRRIVSFTNRPASVPALVAICVSCVSCSGVKCTSIPPRYGKPAMRQRSVSFVEAQTNRE
jgi:hypothetical protein